MYGFSHASAPSTNSSRCAQIAGARVARARRCARFEFHAMSGEQFCMNLLLIDLCVGGSSVLLYERCCVLLCESCECLHSLRSFALYEFDPHLDRIFVDLGIGFENVWTRCCRSQRGVVSAVVAVAVVILCGCALA